MTAPDNETGSDRPESNALWRLQGLHMEPVEAVYTIAVWSAFIVFTGLMLIAHAAGSARVAHAHPRASVAILIVVPFDACFIALRDLDRPDEPMRYALVVDSGQRFSEQVGAPVIQAGAGDRAYTSRVLTSREPLPVSRTEAEVQLLAMTSEAGGRLGDVRRPSATLLFAPLCASDQVMGVMSVQSYSFRAYTERHVELLDAIARQTAVALQNARLLHQVGEAEALRALAHLKDQLLATVSHELRTPLTYIHGYAEYLSLGQQPPERTQRIASQILGAAKHMRRVMEDILSLEQIQQHGVALPPVSLVVEEPIKDALALLEPQLAGQPPTIDVPDGLPLIRADRQRIVRVLVNLLDNALRYARSNVPIRIECRQSGRERVRYCVEDDGVGLTAEQRERVFEKFFRGPLEITGPHAGAGLGLAICRALVEAHGPDCRIWAESDGPGKGSRFYFTLPAARESD